MSDDFKQLKLLYEQIFNTSLEIKSLMDKNEYDEILMVLSRKDGLINKLSLIKNKNNYNENEQEILNNLAQKINEQEKKNISVLEELRTYLKKELQKTKQNVKVVNTYSQNEEKNGSILDFSE